MGIDLILVGRVRTRRPTASNHPLGLVEEMIAIVTGWLGDLAEPPALAHENDDAYLYFEPHPAAPAAEIRLTASGSVQLRARTSAAGPGYHAALCELADALALSLDLEWITEAETNGDAGVEAVTTDETGYFASRDRASLEAYFDSWLRMLAVLCLEGRPNPPSPEPARLCLPDSPEYLYPADFLTPTGPRSAGWARTTATDPSTPDARSFFAWWDLERDAAYWRGIALVELWLHVPPGPAFSAHDVAHQARALAALDRANALDPDLDLPWADWRDLLDRFHLSFPDERAPDADTGTAPEAPELGRAPEPRECAQRRQLAFMLASRAGTTPSTLGYRRHQIRHHLPGGWTIVLSGAAGFEEEEDGTWTAWDGRLAVRFSAVSYADLGDAAPDTARFVTAFSGEEAGNGAWLPERRDNAILGRARLGSVRNQGVLCACLGCPAELAFLTLTFEQPSGRDHALRAWNSVSRSRPPS